MGDKVLNKDDEKAAVKVRLFTHPVPNGGVVVVVVVRDEGCRNAKDGRIVQLVTPKRRSTALVDVVQMTFMIGTFA